MNLQLNITIDDRIMKVLKKVFTGKGLIMSSFLIITFATIIGLSAQSGSDQEIIEFVPGGKIYADDINKNFKLLQHGMQPTGTILAYALPIDADHPAPEGFLLCDGSELNDADFPKLAGMIKDVWGVASLDDKFVLPDLRGQFLRGLDKGDAGKDLDSINRTDLSGNTIVGALVGSYQNDQMASHSHGGIQGNSSKHTGSTKSGTDSSRGLVNNSTYKNSNSYGGSETRPVNAAVNYIIKY